MTLENNVIQRADFNPQIKNYIFAVAAIGMAFSIVGIPVLIVWLLGLGQYVSRRYYENLRCELTDRHLEFKKGMMFKIEKTIPLENIQDLTFIDNPFLKMFDLRILKIETAGQSNPQGSDMKLIGILDSAGFKKKVLHQRELLKADGRPKNAEKEVGGDQTLEILMEIRDILNEIKNKQ